jgi:hypothetical protein
MSSDLTIDESRGMTPERRRYIHEHRKKADLYGPELPFDIRKPRKIRAREIMVECPKCGKSVWVSKVTCMVECTSCKFLIEV